MEELKNEIFEKFIEFGIKIYNHTNDSIYSEYSIIKIIDSDNILISFNISTNPQIAANIILILKDISFKPMIDISEMYYNITELNKIVYGEEAIEKYNNSNEKKTILNFLVNQKEKQLLYSDMIGHA